MDEKQETRKQGSLIGKTANAYGTGRTVFGLGRTAATAIFSAGPEVWVPIIIGVLFLVVLIIVIGVAAPIPISPTAPAPTTAPSQQTP
mgnify:CR=1 FL=1